MAIIISNKEPCSPRPYKPEPVRNAMGYWIGGYEFRQFLGNCYFFLGDELSKIEGMQQLIHHYYLQNGSLSALETANRIRAKWLAKPAGISF